MKIIDLLNKIANGEKIPKYIKYYDRLHQKEDTMMCCYNNIIYKLDNNIFDLLDEVEVIEEDKKIEKILLSTIEGKPMTLYTGAEVEIIEKINEIIDYLEDKNE